MQIIQDISKVLASPEKRFQEILLSEKIYSSPLELSFILFMHLYYLFLPSYLIVINVLVVLMIFIVTGMVYYFMQECLLVYKEANGINIQEDKFFYTIAYCSALANIPALALNLLSNILSIVVTGNLIVGIFFAVLFNFVVLAIWLIYPLKLMKVITGRKHNIKIFFELVAASFITTCKEQLGYKAVKEIFYDFRGLTV